MSDSFRTRVIVLVATAAVSMAAGFGVIWLVVGGRGREAQETASTPPPAAAAAAQETQEAGVKAPAKEAPPPKETAAQEEPPVANEPKKEPDAAAPPAAGGGDGKLAAQLVDATVFKCWKENETEPLAKEACGKLAGVEQIAKANMAGIAKCVSTHAGASPSGKVSLAVKIDFPNARYRAWLGTSSTIEGVEETSACIRKLFQAVPFKETDHTFASYLVIFEISVSK